MFAVGGALKARGLVPDLGTLPGPCDLAQAAKMDATEQYLEAVRLLLDEGMAARLVTGSYRKHKNPKISCS